MQRQSLLQSVKYKLLALKEFEECYIMAKWIRQLFLDVFDQQKCNSGLAPAPDDGTNESNRMTNSSLRSITEFEKGTPSFWPPETGRELLPEGLEGRTFSYGSTPNALVNSHTNQSPWGGWPLTVDLGHPDIALIGNADFSAVGQLPFPWSDYSNPSGLH